MKLGSSFFVGDKIVSLFGSILDIDIYRYGYDGDEYTELFFVDRDNNEILGHLDVQIDANHSRAYFEKFNFEEVA